MTDPGPWRAVAAAGTDPAALARIVAAMAALGAGRLVAAAVDRQADHPDEAPSRVLATVARDRVAVDRIARIWTDLGVRAAVVGDPAYPRRIADRWPHADVPPVLTWRGGSPDERTAVAIVGARRATPYGTGVAAWLAEAAARAGVRVVSGGALGIDAAAHRAALHLPGGTTVVLGCGHDVAYPRGHAAPGALFDQVLAAGGTLLSESLPGAAPRAHRVRARNRIVAGVADTVVVVEGGARSGALLTATAAADAGVAVLAVPGDVRATGSAAPHRLLHEGAAPCTSPADLLAALTVDAGTAARSAAPSVLPGPVVRQLAAAWPRPVPVGDLAAGARLSVPVLLAGLTRARIAGEIAESPEGIRLSRAPGT